MNRRVITALVAGSLCLLAGCTSNASNPSNTSASENTETTKTSITAVTPIVTGYEWGPAVSSVIIELDEPVSSIDSSKAAIRTNQNERTISNAVLVDESGKETTDKSQFIRLDLETNREQGSTPFISDIMELIQNPWVQEYPIEISLDKETADPVELDGAKNFKAPQLVAFTQQKTSTVSCLNPKTQENQEFSLNYRAYEPDALKNDEAKNPLIIWLHGLGEGGMNTDNTLLDNEVTALTTDEIQSQFTSEGGNNGAYLLTVQTPTFWMDEGDGIYAQGDMDSCYLEPLMETIDHYLEENPDIGPSRLYLGDCSNGGYMTMDMAVTYPDRFAALFPICPCYSYTTIEKDADGNYVLNSDEVTEDGIADYKFSDERWFTDEKAASLKDTPVWMVFSANDQTVKPDRYEIPVYQAILNAGNENAWLSCYDQVRGTDDPEAEYPGHYVWIHFFNNQIGQVQDAKAIKDNQQALEPSQTLEPSQNGGSQTVSNNGNEYSSIFEGMNAQKR